MQKKLFLFMLLYALLLSAARLPFISAQGRSTSTEELIKTGISFYSEGKYSEAAHILQLAGTVPEALYWLSLAELSAGNFTKSLDHLDALEKSDPKSRWSEEVPYHRGRCLYYLNRHEEALESLKIFSDSLEDSDSRKSSALYWQGESLLSLGRLDSAATVFSAIVEKYPNSSKYEASYYRLTLINHKKVEVELLALLKWSHEESLKTMENYQEREKNYELAIAAYQKRINELLASDNAAALSIPDEYAGLLPLQSGITELVPFSDSERENRLWELKNIALELSAILTSKLNEAE